MLEKAHYLDETIEHIDITGIDVVPLVDAMRRISYTARDLAHAADIFDRMLGDEECGVILYLAGSLISAGLKKVFAEMIRCRMVVAIVSTGANIFDQDLWKHWVDDHHQGRANSTRTVPP